MEFKFKFAFSWWLRMLNFSYACWLFVFHPLGTILFAHSLSCIPSWCLVLLVGWLAGSLCILGADLRLDVSFTKIVPTLRDISLLDCFHCYEETFKTCEMPLTSSSQHLLNHWSPFQTVLAYAFL